MTRDQLGKTNTSAEARLDFCRVSVHLKKCHHNKLYIKSFFLVLALQTWQ